MILTIFLLDISKLIASFCYMTLPYRRIVHSNYQILSIGHYPIGAGGNICSEVIGSILACWFTPFRLFFLILFDFDFRKDSTVLPQLFVILPALSNLLVVFLYCRSISSFNDSLSSVATHSSRGFFFFLSYFG